ncbi:MAG: DUF1549 domain-containing protein, partial [Aeoliella sp.]
MKQHLLRPRVRGNRLQSVVLLLAAYAVGASNTAAAPPSDDTFGREIAPILQHHCVRCHKTSDPKGDLDLTQHATVMVGDGAVVDAGDPDQSILLDMVSGDQPEMPKEGPPLSSDQVATIRRWIADGAKWPREKVLVDKSLADTNWWSLRPLKTPAQPQLSEQEESWVRTPVDRFVIAKHREQKLSPSPNASRRELIRRLYFDLIGLPPSPEDVEAFVVDEDPNAYEFLVDRLLASERYGERWARHWLDVVHYGDT